MNKHLEADPGKSRVRARLMLGASALAVVVWMVVWLALKPSPSPEPDAGPNPELEARRKEEVQALLERVKSDDATTREDAADELGRDEAARPEEAVPVLIGLLWDREREVRTAARKSLDRRDRDWPRRDEARAGVPRLIAELWVEERDVQLFGEDEETVARLDRIDPDWPKLAEAKVAVPALREARKDKDEGVRSEAAAALKSIDPGTAP